MSSYFLEKIYCPEEQRERTNKALRSNGDLSPDHDPRLLASDDFDPVFIEKNYYVGPDVGKKKSESASKAYSLFVKILNEIKKNSNR